MGSWETLLTETRGPRCEIAHRFRINGKIPQFFHRPSRRSDDQKPGQLYIF